MSATSCERRQDDIQSLVPQSAVDHAVFERILYQQLTYDTKIFDCESGIADQSYMEKIYSVGNMECESFVQSYYL